MKIKTLVAITALSMALLSGSALAHNHGKQDKSQGGKDRSEMMVAKMTERLGLSEQQAIEIKSLMARHKEESGMERDARRDAMERELGLILTPEQKAMFDENKAKRQGKMKERKGQKRQEKALQ